MKAIVHLSLEMRETEKLFAIGALLIALGSATVFKADQFLPFTLGLIITQHTFPPSLVWCALARRTFQAAQSRPGHHRRQEGRGDGDYFALPRCAAGRAPSAPGRGIRWITSWDRPMG